MHKANCAGRSDSFGHTPLGMSKLSCLSNIDTVNNFNARTIAKYAEFPVDLG